MNNSCMTNSDILGLAEAKRLSGEKNSIYQQIYKPNDLKLLSNLIPSGSNSASSVETMEELLERDEQRVKDGFLKKIKVGKLPTRSGKVILIPVVQEEKLVHGEFNPTEDGEAGQGEGEEGDVIGEKSIDEEGEGEGEGEAGDGEGGDHGIETQAYDLGKKLSEEFQLPNLTEKAKKMPTTKYVYDLTDKNRRSGQFLDKNNVDPENFIIAPNDLVYRVLSAEREFESQAIVFLLRDYSGSMSGELTKAVVTQHLLLYSWLMFEYKERVKSRFILHDTEAKEVPNFDTYYRSRVAGGTKVCSAYKLVNKIIAEEELARDYNIYVFHGTDGDDWDKDGQETIAEIKKMTETVNRLGITIVRPNYGTNKPSEVEVYLKASKILETHSDLLKLDVINHPDFGDTRLIEGIKKLTSIKGA